MKNLAKALLLTFWAVPAFCQTEVDIDRQVKEIMSTMELVDKVGEMTQLAIDMISVGAPYNLNEPQKLDEKKLRQILVDQRVGSILNVGAHAYTLDYWHEVIRTIQKIATEEKPTKIPVLYGIDAIHGANYTMGSTLLPQEIALAATWNPDLAYQAGKITAYETRASWIPWNFAPVLDIGRDPRWPRFWETLGEDVLLASEMGVAMISGMEGNDDLSDPYQVASCMKHFLGYSLPLTGKDRTQAWIPERQLREYVIPTFQKAIDAGAETVMICSGEINGIPVHADEWVLKDLLRDEMGFEGLAVSDWEDIINLYTRHRVAKDHKDAIRIAINAGIDMSMVPTDTQFPVLLKELVEEGKVPMSRIDEAVERIIRLKIKLGLFTEPYPAKANYDQFASEAHTQVAYNAAIEAITLLKNDDNLLPLEPGFRILVTGPTANSILYLNGGWSRTWQGNDPKYGAEPGKLTISDALKNFARTTYVKGSDISSPDASLGEAIREARQADVAVICVGEATYTEKPGDIPEVDIPDAQLELVKAIAATGTPIVLVLVEGRPRIIREMEPFAKAIVHAYLPGSEGGRAVTDILSGKANPSGKLPFTYPKYSNSLFVYDHKGTDVIPSNDLAKGFDVQFEFGHGLSYTTFEYSDLRLSADQIDLAEQITIEVDVANTGERTGKEVVQLYVADRVASITPSVKRLRGFKKVSLEPGEKRTIKFVLSADDLAFVGKDMEWITEPGLFEVMVANQKMRFEIK